MLDFSTLNDLALAARRRPDAVLSRLRTCSVNDIGPAAEYVLLRSSTGLPSLVEAPLSQTLQALRVCLSSGSVSNSTTIEPAPEVEFTRCPATPEEAALPGWTAFRLRMEAAARLSGFGVELAKGLVGATGEMTSNVIEHSGLPRTGFVGYRWRQTSFEFVVADRGWGALESLRSCPEHAHLSDAGDALHLCIQEGISRHGTGTGRGFGFRQMFANLAAQSGHVRIRSDDQAIDVDGRQPIVVTATPTQQPPLRGFLAYAKVASPGP